MGVGDLASPRHNRRKHEFGDLAVARSVSDGWLELLLKGSAEVSDGEAIPAQAKPKGAAEKPRRICELIPTGEDLRRVFSLIERTLALV